MAYNQVMNASETPEPKLAALSFATTSVAGLEEWAANLPLVNAEETGLQLKRAVAEIMRLDAEPKTRIKLIDTLRPLAHYACTRLSKVTTEPPLITPNALLNQLVNAYFGCFEETRDDDSLSDRAARDALSRSAHRVFADSGRLLLRSLQNHSAVPVPFWNRVHEVFREIEGRELNDHKVEDEENVHETLTIQQAYLRMLLLKVCRPNQLPADQLALTYNALEHWVKVVSLERESAAALFAIDTLSNEGPRLARYVTPAEATRALDTSVVAYELDAYLEEVNSTMTVPEYMPAPLIRHLSEAWSTVTARSFSRSPANGTMRICVGLRAVHYFLSGGVDFGDQMSQSESYLRREINPFIDIDYEPRASKVDDDPWKDAHDLKVRIPINPNIANPERILNETVPPADAPARKFEHHEIRTLDTSPNGHRVQWIDDVPLTAEVGTIVAIREESDSRWCIAALRWISGRGRETQMGLELLSPRAIAVAVRPIMKKGGVSSHGRALILPSIEAIGQPATIITPRLPFKAGLKVSVQRQGIQSTALLLTLTQNTDSFNQFTFRMLDGYLEKPNQRSTMDPLSVVTGEDTSRGRP